MAHLKPLSELITLSCFLLFLSVFCSAQTTSSEEAFMDWIRASGARLNVKIGRDENGRRGLYTIRAVKKGETFFSIPATRVINVGAAESSYAVPLLNFYRELKSNCSRFRPYIDMMPGPSEVLDWFNFPTEYIPMIQAKPLEDQIYDYAGSVRNLINGAHNEQLEITLEEVYDGPLNVEDLKYAGSLSATRYINMEPRKVLLMAPIFDLANHVTGCQHWTQYPNSRLFELIAGEDVEAGAEVCYSYGDLRLDDALVRYGFVLPDEPPFLANVDHHLYDGKGSVPLNDYFPVHTATPEEMAAEVSRLEAIINELVTKSAANPPPVAGKEHVHALLLEYQEKRQRALRLEIARIKTALGQEEAASHEEL